MGDKKLASLAHAGRHEYLFALEALVLEVVHHRPELARQQLRVRGRPA